MKLGKRKNPRTKTDVQTPNAPVYRRHFRSTSKSLSRHAGRLVRPEAPHLICGATNCESKHNSISRADAVVKVELGFVHYHKNFINFEQNFPVNPEGEVEVFFHAICAMDSGVRFESLKEDECCLCKRQFFCEREPRETVVWIQHGNYNENGEFTPKHEGAVHWCCAKYWWGDEISDAFRGPYGRV